MNEIERKGVGAPLLRSFVEVVDAGSVSAAAKALGRTQSAVSVQMRRLEEALGARLLEREARGVRLTADGRRLLPAARRTIEEIGKIGDLFAEPLLGRVRLGLPEDYGEDVLENVLSMFTARHPKVHVEARLGCGRVFPKLVSAGELDIAVASNCAGEEAEAALFEEGIVWAGARSLKLTRVDPVPLVVLDRACGWRELPTDALTRAGRAWRIASVTDSFLGFRATLRSGIAIGALPERSLDERLRVFGKASGLPHLDPVRRRILANEKTPRPIVDAMSTAIKSAQSAHPQ